MNLIRILDFITSGYTEVALDSLRLVNASYLRRSAVLTKNLDKKADHDQRDNDVSG